MKKAFDQTVRELKREVNKKVLKVPGVEQKILDATSNELWGPHGSLLADIAQATRNYHEYQIIMHVIWKRLNDTGKNWRHVYKSLTVLEYLVGHGSERVIDEIKEHVYQISTLSDFQYIDSSGKDQGNNVRRKSQALVSLINDKEKILEVRQKALANKDKFRPTFSSGGSYKPGSYSSASGYGDRYDEDRYEGRYGSRDDDRNGYEREKDSGYKDDDRYSKGGDFYRDGDGYGRDSDEHSGRGSYKNDDNRGDRGNDDYQLGPRNKSLDKDREHSYEEDDNYSYRNGGGRVNDSSPEGRYNERKPSEQNVVAPPNYESAVRNSNNNTEDQRDGGIGTITDSSKFEPAARKESLPPQSTGQAVAGVHLSPQMMDDTFDEFDPRGFTPAVNSAPVAASFTSSSGGPVVDLFGNSSPMDPADSLALVLAAPTIAASETETGTTNSGFGMDFVALSTAAVTFSQPTEDPFGDAPFKAVSHENFPNQEPYSAPMVSARASFPLSSSSVPSSEPISTVGSMLDTASMDFGFGGPLSGLTYMPSSNSPLYAPNPSITTSELPLPQPNIDALNTHLGHSNLYPTNTLYPHASAPVQVFASTNAQTANSGFIGAGPSPVHSVHPVVQPNMPSSVTPKTSSNNISALSNKKQDTFETKSSVWADTLNRGIVNLNISGAKTNPLADIGVDFDSINRLERRKEKEKSSANLVTSTVTMGKAMGSGSGIGRAGAGAISQTTRPAAVSGMGMGMGMGPGGPGGMGMGSYGATMNQTMGLGMGMGMGQGSSMRPLPEMQSPPPVFPGAGYNSSMGMGGYASHQPYGGGGYR